MSYTNTNSIFQKEWWLDAVSPNTWETIKIHNGNSLAAQMPYIINKKNGITRLSMPPLTQSLGPWLTPTSGKYAKQLSHQKELMTEIIANLPYFDSFTQKFHYSITNWLPFYWAGFSQTTVYTYVIEELIDLDKVWSCFEGNIRSEVRKAEKIVSVETNMSVEDFLNVNKLTFQRQGLKLPYKPELVKRIDLACEQQSSRKIFYAKDSSGNIHAAIYLIWDENSAYYLMGGADPLLRSSGATSLLLWEAIKFAGTVTKKFDFEGSMLEPVERYVRGFGAIQKPYFIISKTNARYRNFSKLKSLIKF